MSKPLEILFWAIALWCLAFWVIYPLVMLYKWITAPPSPDEIEVSQTKLEEDDFVPF